jgi:tetratricopeptide (TPR) repeat protein
MRFLRLLAMAVFLAAISNASSANVVSPLSSGKPDAIMLENYGEKELRNRNLEAALHYFDAAIEANPRMWIAYYNRAKVLERQGKWELVVRDTTIVLQQPKWLTNAGALRGIANSELGHYQAALADFDKVIGFNIQDTAYFRALNGRAWLRATCPDAAFRNGPQALQDAKRVAAVLRIPAAIDTLAAAFAEVGDFNSAIGWEELAIAAIKPSMKDADEERLALEKRISSFKQHRPWRAHPK